MKKFVITAIVIGLLALLWHYISPSFIVVELNEETPPTKEVFDNGFERESLGVISDTDFVPNAYDVAGRAYLIEAIDGQIYLRFEGFNIINGPDVRVLLSKDLERNDFVEIGPLKANRGNFNYVVPEDVNLEEYSKVLIWSEDFGALFAFADFER